MGRESENRQLANGPILSSAGVLRVMPKTKV